MLKECIFAVRGINEIIPKHEEILFITINYNNNCI